MKILMISADATLGKKDVIDDTSQFRDVLQSLAKELEEVHVICKSIYDVTSPWREKNIFVYPIRRSTVPYYIWRVFHLGKKNLKNIKIDLITSQDVLQCGLPAYILKKLYHVPLLMELHGDYLNNPVWLKQGLRYRFYNLVGKWLLRHGNFVRVTSLQIQKTASEIGIPAERMYYVPHRTDIKKFNPAIDSSRLRTQLNLQNKRIILFIGRLTPEKSPLDALKVFVKVHETLSDTHLVMIGDGPLRSQLDALINSLGINQTVTLIKRVPNKEIPPFYTLADVLLLTSIFEGRPKVIQEALACGRPVVATALSGVTELVINGETGFIAPVGDINALANNLIGILKNPVRYEQMKIKCRMRMENDFTWERGIAEMLKAYKLAVAHP